MAGLAAAVALAGRADVTVFEATERRRRQAPDRAARDRRGRRVVPGPSSRGARRGRGGRRRTSRHPATTSASVWTRTRTATAAVRDAARRAHAICGRARGVLGLREVWPARPWTGCCRGPDSPTTPRSAPSYGPGSADRVVDRLVDPLLGGVYAGSADGLSLRVTVPQLVPALQERSLLRRRPSPPPDADPGRRTGLRDPDRRHGQLRARLWPAAAVPRSSSDAPVRSLHRDQAAGGASSAASSTAVVVAVPAAARAAKLLAPLGVAGPGGAVRLGGHRDVRLPVRHRAARPAAVCWSRRPVARAMKAATFLSQKWPHLAGRADGPDRAGQRRAVRRRARPAASDVELLGVAGGRVRRRHRGPRPPGRTRRCAGGAGDCRSTGPATSTGSRPSAAALPRRARRRRRGLGRGRRPGLSALSGRLARGGGAARPCSRALRSSGRRRQSRDKGGH